MTKEQQANSLIQQARKQYPGAPLGLFQTVNLSRPPLCNCGSRLQVVAWLETGRVTICQCHGNRQLDLFLEAAA